jgi:hypothetical protein
MRTGLLCSLAFLVGPALAQAQQAGYYNPSWPSASPGAVQGYGYYQQGGAPAGNSGYNYQNAYGYSYQNPYYQNSYYQNQYPNAYQNWYQQAQGNGSGAYANGAYANGAYANGAYANGAYASPQGWPTQPWSGQGWPTQGWPAQGWPAQGWSGDSSVTANRVAPAPSPVIINEERSPEAGQAEDGQPMLHYGLPGFGDMGPDPAELAQPPQPPVESIARTSVAGDCFWFSADYILAWTKHMPTPPLITTGAATLLATGGTPGALNQPSTQILFGGHPLAFGNPASGARFNTGVWLDHDNHFSLDFGIFFLPKAFNRFALQSDVNGNPTIARPVINAVTGQEQAFFDALPGVPSLFIAPVATGGTNIAATQSLWGFDLNARYHCFLGAYLHAEGLIGFRYLRLEEDLSIQDNTTPLIGGNFLFLGNSVPTGTLITDFDSFRTTNQFTGFQLGGRLRWDCGRCFFDLTGKAAVGADQESVMINGATTVAGVTAPGGILAVPSNIGNHNRTVVSFVPEVGVNAGVNLTRWCRLNAGYNFLFWNNVVRAGDQIDRAVNGNQVPTAPDFGTAVGPSRPLFAFHESNFWVQYINIGVELHY